MIMNWLRADDAKTKSLAVWIENLDMNGRVVACTCHWLSAVIWIFRFQVVHQLHGGGVCCQLKCPLAAGLQLQRNVDCPVNRQAQAMDTDLPVSSTFEQLLATSQLGSEICFHVDVDVIPSLGEFAGKALPQGVLHGVHLDRGCGGVRVHWVCLRDGGHGCSPCVRHASVGGRDVLRLQLNIKVKCS